MTNEDAAPSGFIWCTDKINCPGERVLLPAPVLLVGSSERARVLREYVDAGFMTEEQFTRAMEKS